LTVKLELEGMTQASVSHGWEGACLRFQLMATTCGGKPPFLTPELFILECLPCVLVSLTALTIANTL